MLYSIIRIILALAAAAVVFVMSTYSAEEKRFSPGRRGFESKAALAAAATFAAAVVALHLLPAENLIVGFSDPASAFRYNSTGEIMEINEYPDCALVIASTGDEKLTVHVLPVRNDGRWQLETIYNRRREVSTLHYCMVERLYVPHSDNCFVVVSHNTTGNISDTPASVVDNRNTRFTAVDYPDRVTFYYGYVEDMSDDYRLYVDGQAVLP